MIQSKRIFSLANVALMTATLSVASGCRAEGQGGATSTQANPADVQARIEALKNKTLKDLVFVEGGTFKMGDFGPVHSEEGLQYSTNADDNVLHEVTLDSYSVMAHKVTYANFDIYTDAEGKPRIAQDSMDLKYRNIPGMPAGVSWYDARAYCQWLGSQLNKPMDLLTEAQWEYAARSRGQMLIFATDNGKIDDGRNVPSFDQKDELEVKNNTTYVPQFPVGQYPPNPLGLYDMVGNGYEWVLDSYKPAYDNSPKLNPLVLDGDEKVQRGYATAGGDTLQLVAMSFVRSAEAPEHPPELDSDGEPYNDNLHSADTFRCASNSTAEVAR